MSGEAVPHLAADKVEDGFNKILETAGHAFLYITTHTHADIDDQGAQHQGDKDGIKIKGPETGCLVCHRIAIPGTQIGEVMLDILDGPTAARGFGCLTQCTVLTLIILIMSHSRAGYSTALCCALNDCS